MANRGDVSKDQQKQRRGGKGEKDRVSKRRHRTARYSQWHPAIKGEWQVPAESERGSSEKSGSTERSGRISGERLQKNYQMSARMGSEGASG